MFNPHSNSRSTSQPDDVLTLAGAARLLKLCEKTTAKLAQSGELPARRVGVQWRFSRRAVLAYIEGGPVSAAIPATTAAETSSGAATSQAKPHQNVRPASEKWRRLPRG